MTQPDELARGLREFATSLIRSIPTDALSRTSASTLSCLAREGATRITTLAEHESVTQPAMTGLVQRLESSGLVERSADPRDGRVALIDITPLGREAIDRRRSIQDAIISDRLATLSPDETVVIERALPVLNHLMELHVV